MQMKKWLLVVAVLILAYTLFVSPPGSRVGQAPSSHTEPHAANSAATIAEAFSERQSDVQVSGHGVVLKLLPDDTRGSRHQRFILKLPSQQTLLIAHNIDLAPRIDALQKGDTVRFYGEYEWNPEGGVLHWTHRDPRGVHAGGWVEHKGRRYR
mgnify:CR=1 FL=1